MTKSIIRVRKALTKNDILPDSIDELRWGIGKHYPKGLKVNKLFCSKMRYVTHLPEGLERFYSESVLVFQTELPEGLKVLVVDKLMVPTKLPDSLEYLICNSVITLPKVLPKGLKVLSAMSVVELPKKLPETLTILCCDRSLAEKRKVPIILTLDRMNMSRQDVANVNKRVIEFLKTQIK